MENQDFLLKQIELLGKILRGLISRLIPLTLDECENTIKELQRKGELTKSSSVIFLDNLEDFDRLLQENLIKSENSNLILECLIILCEKSKEEENVIKYRHYLYKIDKLSKLSNLTFETIIRINKL